MTKMKRPPKGKWKIGDVATFGGVVGRVVACDPALGGWPLLWVTTEPGQNYGGDRKGMLVRFDMEGKFLSWHREPLLSFVRRPTQEELDSMTVKQGETNATSTYTTSDATAGPTASETELRNLQSKSDTTN
jgi:hypothetical protein